MITARSIVLDIVGPDGEQVGTADSQWTAKVALQLDREVRWPGGRAAASLKKFAAITSPTPPTVEMIALDDPSIIAGQNAGILIAAEFFPKSGARIMGVAPPTERDSWKVTLRMADPEVVNFSEMDTAEPVGIELVTVSAMLAAMGDQVASELGTEGSPARDAMILAAGETRDEQIASQVSSSSSATRSALTSDFATVAKTASTMQELGTVNINKLPSRVLTADAKRVGSVEVMAVRAVDHVAVGSADMSADFQSLVNDAASRGMRLALQDGVYKMTNVSLPKYAHISTTSTIGVVFPSGEGRGRVRIQQIDGATTPVFNLASGQGRGIVLRDMTIMGQPMSAVFPTQTETMQPALLSADEMFECRLDRVQFTQNWGPAMMLNSCSNTQFDDVQVKMCGHPSTAAVVLSGAAVCNVVDFNRLRVEFQPNVAIQVGNVGGTTTGWPAEFIRFVGLHVESPDPASVTGMPTSYYNADGLVRLGNVRSVDFDHPFIYGSVGGLITHEQASGLGFTNGHLGGITITGGTLLGRDRAGNNRSGQNRLNPYLVRLVRGDNFVTRGTRMVQYAADGSAVRIESGYGARVDIDTHAFHGTDDTTLTAIKDMRTTNAPTVAVETPAGTGATIALGGGSNTYTGTVTLTSGTASQATGPQFKVLFPKALGSNARVTLTPVGVNASGRQAYLSGQWTTGFQVGFGVAPGNSQGCVFNYTVVEP